jgi:hypothetical protein
MIKPSSFTHDWICKVSKENKADRILVEKAIRALALLEGLANSSLSVCLQRRNCPNADVSKAASPFYRH